MKNWHGSALRKSGRNPSENEKYASFLKRMDKEYEMYLPKIMKIEKESIRAGSERSLLLRYLFRLKNRRRVWAIL